MTTNDILDALRDYMGNIPNGDGATLRELMSELQRGEVVVKNLVRQLLLEGRAEVVLLKRERMDGIQTTVRGYRLRAAATSGPIVRPSAG